MSEQPSTATRPRPCRGRGRARGARGRRAARRHRHGLEERHARDGEGGEGARGARHPHEVRVMSAHRDPDMVADYARTRSMRGLRVIIAGAGLSAALPGRRRRAHRPAGDRRAAHLPRCRVAGGLDALLSIAQMPPGVPVGCVGLDNARNAADARGAHPRPELIRRSPPPVTRARTCGCRRRAIEQPAPRTSPRTAQVTCRRRQQTRHAAMRRG